MTQGLKEINAASLVDPERFLHEVVEGCEPVVLRGLIGHWPAVQAAKQSPLAFRDYVAQFDAGGQMEAFFGERHIEGKYYYSEDLKGFNFERRRMRFSEALDTIVATVELQDAPSVYIGSIPVNDHLPGFTTQNTMPILDTAIAPRIWLGHASNVSSHYDTVENIACVIAGKRRFTLFSPELIGSLYVGPIDNTMSGPPVSFAASSPPDDAEISPIQRDQGQGDQR